MELTHENLMSISRLRVRLRRPTQSVKTKSHGRLTETVSGKESGVEAWRQSKRGVLLEMTWWITEYGTIRELQRL